LLQRILVVNRQDLVIAVSDHDSGGAAFDAFLGAGCGTGIGTFGPALGIADPAIYGLGLAHVVG
jgi:hypothetical protein